MRHSMRLAFVGGLVLVVAPVAGGCRAPVKTASEDAMVALAEKTLEIWNDGNLDLVSELYTPDYVRHELDIRDDSVGQEQLASWVSQLRGAYPDLEIRFEDVFTGPDRVVARWHVTGTNTGPRRGQPGTGHRIHISGVSVTRIRDGRIAEEWVIYNQQRVLEQLGLSG